MCARPRPSHRLRSDPGAAIGRGAVSRRDEVQVVEQRHEVELCTATAAIQARYVVLAGARPAALIVGSHPVWAGPLAVRRSGRVVVARATGSFLVPALGREIADLVLAG